ncbi:MAG: DUF120 domain-containing protein [archaeon]
MVDTLMFLLVLAEKGAAFSSARLSTISLAGELKISQQSASRILKELEGKGLISRDPSYQGVDVSLTEKGLSMLQVAHRRLSGVFTAPDNIKGKAVIGIGEAAWYIQRYATRIKDVLGYSPFPGTLNVKVDVKEFKRLLAGRKPIRVDAFKLEGRTFGGASLYPGKIDGIDVAIIHADRSRHDDDIMEVVSEVELRKRLDGNSVHLELT